MIEAANNNVIHNVTVYCHSFVANELCMGYVLWLVQEAMCLLFECGCLVFNGLASELMKCGE